MSEKKKKQKPTRIVDGPIKTCIPGCSARVNSYLCNDGSWYTMRELADIIGIKYHTVKTRMVAYGLFSALVFMKKARKGYRIDGEKQDAPGCEQGNVAWQQLGVRPRTGRLEKIKKPGIFELRM